LPASPGGRFEQRGATVDGKLGIAGEDDEHLITAIVEMLADAAARRDDALSLIQYIMADALRQRIRHCRRDKSAESTGKRNGLHISAATSNTRQ